MSYEEFCAEYRYTPSEGGKALYEDARRTVANEIAGMFGIGTAKSDEDRFLAALEKAASEKEEK